MKWRVLEHREKAKSHICYINIFTTVFILRPFSKVFPHPDVSLARIPLIPSLPMEMYMPWQRRLVRRAKHVKPIRFIW